MTNPPERPRVDLHGAAQRAFEAAARAAGFDPLDPWVGGYADYEWDHLRCVLDAYGVELAGRDVLEFGCNVGASAVVLAALGARVSGVDIHPPIIPIAEANLARHGLAGTIRPSIGETALPFANASFDVIVANSVLEYADPARLPEIIAELHRVLRPGGRLFICATASRLALREGHSRRWLVNFLPPAIDRLTGRPLQRGLAPWRLAAALRGRFTDESGQSWLAARRAVHGAAAWPLRLYALVGRATSRGAGWFAPNIELLLRRC